MNRMKQISAEELAAKSKQFGKELTVEQAEEMIRNKKMVSDDDLTSVSGGSIIDDISDAVSDYTEDAGLCPNSWDGEHDWQDTGVTRPGRIFGDYWPDCECRCTKCGKTGWNPG